jgi:hypothetical protein
MINSNRQIRSLKKKEREKYATRFRDHDPNQIVYQLLYE